MDAREQASGEARVRQLLVEPLMRRGLARPSALTKAGFDEMIADLCARLAYMSEASLLALEEQVAGNPGGKEQDRFPIANRILSWAAVIQPPAASASPLVRAVFGNELGQRAIAEGWAPELLAEVRHSRRWPSPWAVNSIQEKAWGAVRRMRDVEARLAREGELPAVDAVWRARRLEAMATCQRIADLAGAEG